MPKAIDLTGQRFGRLVVTGKAPKHYTSGGTPVVMWFCDCDYININKKYTYLGTYVDFNEAVSIRKTAEEKYYGIYSYDNSQKISQL